MSEAEALFHRSIEVKLAFLADGGAQKVEAMAAAVIAAYRRGHAFYLFGNGGSAADAQHLAGELVGRFMMERAALPCEAFSTNSSVVTAIANDYGYDAIFSRQVEAFVRKGDVVLGLSTSGNSPNVLKALELAKARGAVTLGFSGKGGGRLAEIADIAIVAPSDVSARIQEVHITAGHILCDLVERGLFAKKSGRTTEARRTRRTARIADR